MPFKFVGKIGEREVVVMISTASAHNFISKNLVNELQIPVAQTDCYRVLTAGGPPYSGSGVCNNVVLTAQGLQFTQRFYPTIIATNTEVVLGSEWLESVNPYLLSVAEGGNMVMTMNINDSGDGQKLHPDPSLVQRIEFGVMRLVWDDVATRRVGMIMKAAERR